MVEGKLLSTEVINAYMMPCGLSVIRHTHHTHQQENCFDVPIFSVSLSISRVVHI